MSNRFKHAVIDASLQDNLLDLFESTMKSVATTLVLETKFDTIHTLKDQEAKRCRIG